jgi:hypothetical protein
MVSFNTHVSETQITLQTATFCKVLQNSPQFSWCYHRTTEKQTGYKPSLWREEECTEDHFFKNFKRMTDSKGGGRAFSMLWVGHGPDSRGNGLRFPERAIFHFWKASRPSLQPTQYSTHWVPVALTPGSKATGTRGSIKIRNSEWVELQRRPPPHAFTVCARTILPLAATSQESFSFCCWRPKED